MLAVMSEHRTWRWGGAGGRDEPGRLIRGGGGGGRTAWRPRKLTCPRSPHRRGGSGRNGGWIGKWMETVDHNNNCTWWNRKENDELETEMKHVRNLFKGKTESEQPHAKRQEANDEEGEMWHVTGLFGGAARQRTTAPKRQRRIRREGNIRDSGFELDRDGKPRAHWRQRTTYRWRRQFTTWRR